MATPSSKVKSLIEQYNKSSKQTTVPASSSASLARRAAPLASSSTNSPAPAKAVPASVPKLSREDASWDAYYNGEYKRQQALMNRFQQLCVLEERVRDGKASEAEIKECADEGISSLSALATLMNKEISDPRNETNQYTRSMLPMMKDIQGIVTITRDSLVLEKNKLRSKPE